jgi:hypothetical protein
MEIPAQKVPCSVKGGRRLEVVVSPAGISSTCVSNHAAETGRVLELDPGTPPRAVIFSGILG